MWKSVSPLYRDRGCILRSGAKRRRHVTALCLSVRRRAWDRKTENWTTKWNLNRESVKVQRCDWSRCYAQSGVGQMAVSGCGGLYKQSAAAAVVVASSDLQRFWG